MESKKLSNWVDKLIGKGERLTGLDVRYYLKNTPFLAMNEVVSLACGLASSMAFTRLVPKETYGQYTFLFSILGILLITSIPGMTTAIQQSVARGYDRVFIDGTKIRMKWSLLGSLAAFSVGLYYYFDGSPDMAKAFMVSALFFPLYSSADSFTFFLLGKTNFTKSAVYQSIGGVVSTSVIIVVLFFSQDLLWIALAGVGSMSLTRLYFLSKTIRQEKLNQNTDKKAFTYARHLTYLNIVPMVADQYDNIIIAPLLGFQNLAIYAIATAANHFLSMFRGIVQTMAFPRIAAMETQTAISAVKKKGLYLWLLHGILVVIGIALLPYVVPLLFTPAYSPVIPYASVLFITSFLAVPGGMFNILFKAQRGTRQLYGFTIFGRVLRIVLLTILVPYLGLWGAVLVEAIQRAGESLLTWWLTNRWQASLNKGTP